MSITLAIYLAKLLAVINIYEYFSKLSITYHYPYLSSEVFGSRMNTALMRLETNAGSKSVHNLYHVSRDIGRLQRN